MKQTFGLFVVLLCFAHCKKKDAEGDLAGKEYIRGRLFLYDQLTQNSFSVPLGEKKVSVAYANVADTVNFVFSVVTDKEGYFVFPNLKKDTTYRLYYEETVNGVLYKAIGSSKAPTDTLRLNAYVSNTGQNGLHLVAVDENGTVLNGVTHCVFSSPLITGYTNNACDGSSYKLTSNPFGQSFKFSIPQGTYYTNSLLDVNGVPFFSKDTTKVSADGIAYDTIRLKAPNGMKFTVMDSLGTRMAGASICVFTSLALYQQDTCDGSNFQLTSLVNGEASRYNLPPQRYYIYSTYKTNTFIWVARDTIDLTTHIVQDSLILRKKR